MKLVLFWLSQTAYAQKAALPSLQLSLGGAGTPDQAAGQAVPQGAAPSLPAPTLANGLPGATGFVPNNVDGDHVTDDAGTGFVHTAPGHGADDYVVWLASGLPTPRFAILTADSDWDAVVAQLGRPVQTLVDARGAPRYRGDVEPLDPVAGHIPGALNRPFTDNFTADGHFKPAQVLRSEWTQLLAGRPPASVVHHCGSGVSAVPNLIAMELAGFGPTALYAGSWSEWSRTPGLPCAKG